MMKKIILIAVAGLVSVAGFAQKTAKHTAELSVTAFKATAIGDTLRLSNIGATDTVRVLYTHTPSGNGYTAGTNVYNDMGFAERYSFNGSDSSIKVIGVLAQFGGTVTASSTKTITLKVWGQGSESAMIAPNTYYQGHPDGIVDSLVVPITKIGIGPTKDTLKKFMFASPTNYLSGAFFAGYTIDYNFATLSGDTIALAASTDGHRTASKYTLNYITNATGDTTRVDTFINMQNATLWSDGTWKDNYTQNDSLYNNLAIFPIVIISAPTATKGITHNNLTLFGAYPNPATHNTSIRVGLAAGCDIMLEIVDLNGRALLTEKHRGLRGGEHIFPINTTNLPNGEYLYIIHTSTSDGIAGKIEVLNN